jgi:hypothetical protein
VAEVIASTAGRVAPAPARGVPLQPAEDVIHDAIEQPADVSVSEIIVRPTGGA